MTLEDSNRQPDDEGLGHHGHPLVYYPGGGTAKFATTSGGTGVTSVSLPANTQSVTSYYAYSKAGSPIITVGGQRADVWYSDRDDDVVGLWEKNDDGLANGSEIRRSPRASRRSLAATGQGRDNCLAHSDGRRDEAGAVLVLALLFVLVVGAVVGSIATWATNDLNNTAKFTSARTLQYAFNGATEVAVQNIRYTPLLATTVPGSGILLVGRLDCADRRPEHRCVV